MKNKIDLSGTDWQPMETVPPITIAPPILPNRGVIGQTIDILFDDGTRISNCFPYHNRWAYVKWTQAHTVTAIPSATPIGWMHPPIFPASLEDKVNPIVE